MRLSVIIPAYNNLPGVLTALNSLRALAAEPHEYLVQDDASPDVLYQALIPPELASVVRNPANVGFAQNCNLAAARASGEVLLFVNQDVYGHPTFSRAWDAALLEPFNEPKVGIVGARLLFPDGRVQSAGGRFDMFCQPYHPCLGWQQINHPDVSTARDMPWVTGAAFAVRRWLWETLGGFDTVYAGGYFEDVDLCLRARARGLLVRYQPHWTLVHSVGSTGGNPQFMQNAAEFKRRWVDTKKVQPDVPTKMVQFWA